MIAASSIETEGNNGLSVPTQTHPKCFHNCLQSLSLPPS